MAAYHDKGEIKERYYNPGSIFDEVHMVSFCNKDIDPAEIKEVAGDAKLFIHAVGFVSLFSFPFILANIFRLIKRVSPDALRAYDPSLRGALAVLCGKRFGIHTVISLHADLDAQRVFRKDAKFSLRRLLEKYSLGNVDKVICVTEYIVPYAKRYGAKDVAVIYNRVDVKRFSNGKKRIDHNVKEILCVARLDSQKYQECLIRAVKDIDVHLTLIGNGSLKGRLKGLADELGISGKVAFIDSVPHKNIQSYYFKSDIFAIATHYEGFCIPVIEAMASGIPVVASDIPPIREVVGDAGILLDNEPELFRDAFIKLKNDKDCYMNLSKAGKDRVLVFDSGLMEEKERRFYESLMIGQTT